MNKSKLNMGYIQYGWTTGKDSNCACTQQAQMNSNNGNFSRGTQANTPLSTQQNLLQVEPVDAQ